ncbi:MAG: NOB1 family endonuclease [Candidatus Thorarchaeota archaeon]
MTLQKNSNKNKGILIFDTNIFLTGIDFNLINGIIYSTPTIINEIKIDKYINKNRNILNKIQAAIDSKKLFLKTPSNKYIDEVEKKSRLTGDYYALSNADKELIGLTLELMETLTKNVIIYTNDYSIENVCSQMNIPFSPLLKNGIKSKIIWEVYCPFCKEIHKTEDLIKNCEKCGSKLKRRPKK